MIAIAPHQQVLSLPQRVQAVEARIDGQLIQIRSHARGTVARVHVAQGDLVHRGDLLLELEPRVTAHGNGIATEIHAPATGRVLSLNAMRGEVVARRDLVASILHANELWALARFAPADFVRLRVGQYARVRTASHVLVGRVGGLRGARDPVLLDLVGRSATALRPGMAAAVAVEVD
jgi:multidrug resistance efflux pump